jgi:sugar phosphate isomerase/epimerase
MMVTEEHVMSNSTGTLGVSTSLCRGEVKSLPQPVESISEEDSVAVYLALLDRFAEFALEEGFDTIEIELGFSMICASDLLLAVGEIGKRISPFRTVSCHLPLGEINISALHPGVRRQSIDETKRHIDLCEQLGIINMVVHPGCFAAAPDRYQLLAGQTRETSWASVSEIADYCHKKGMVLSIENLQSNEPFYQRPGEFETFVRAGLGLTLDVAHAYGSSVDPLDFIAAFGRRITEVHLSDGKRSDPLSHYALGAGETDCCAVLHGLDKVGFDGTIVLEVDSTEAVIESKSFLRQNGFFE